HFYRVKTIQLNGQESYSGIVKVNMASAEGGLTVYPNPVQSGTINLVFKGEVAGSYPYKLVNSSGQAIRSGIIKYAGGTSLHSINTAQQLAAGTYELQVQKPQGLAVIKVMVL
ncbi:T9SS type A sorting domain-containing protein, partial [Segetibacter sp. 3557_3]|uniref:T9SS type A sorting domain-containing protein n=1 Tax=Segetibacter sp. 3557_3 TaxID=2547429 RepID=UPI001058B53D